MRKRDMVMIGLVGAYGYLVTRELIDISDRFEKIEENLAEIKKNEAMVSNGVDISKIVDINDYKEVL